MRFTLLTEFSTDGGPPGPGGARCRGRMPGAPPLASFAGKPCPERSRRVWILTSLCATHPVATTSHSPFPVAASSAPVDDGQHKCPGRYVARNDAERELPERVFPKAYNKLFDLFDGLSESAFKFSARRETPLGVPR